MKKQYITTLLACFIVVQLYAQYTTPDTGVNWTLDDIANNSPSTVTVSGTTYTLLEDVTIAENDALVLNSELTLEIETDVLVTVFGSFTIDATETITITAVENTAPYDGFRFEEFSEINIQNALIEYGGGLRVLTENFTLNNCELKNNVGGVATGAVVSMSRGTPNITNNTFLNNATPAIGSASNSTLSANIFNNYIEGNNQDNDNRPQINLGPTETTDTLKIVQNTIIGDPALDQAGGIAVSNLLGSGDILAIIDDNTIQNNCYGITIMGANSFAYIRNNIIENNNTQGDPNLGGSGINLNSPNQTMEIVASNNEIRGNLWGITLQGDASINLGDGTDNPGGNVFSDNGNGGSTYALYNNTPHGVTAQYNCWVEDGEGTLEEAEDVISHQVDMASLGLVVFDPVDCNGMNASEIELTPVTMYPNPATNYVSFRNTSGFNHVMLYDIHGKKVIEQPLESGDTKISFTLPSGLYFAKFSGKDSPFVSRLLVK